ncbi:MAG: hypothetical protein K2Q20_10530 [Phycisphaerales bacterium]|nr:hypothetical protein [Phycisphaerales bacterium]
MTPNPARRSLAMLLVAALSLAACDDRRASPAPTASPGPAPASAAVAPPATSTPELLVGFWNIEWLGKPDNRSGPARDIAQKPEDIADAIIDSKVCILGLAEIVAPGPGRPIRSPELEAVVDVLNTRTKQRWEYVLSPGRSDGDQLTGLLWNTARVTALNDAGKPWQQGRDEPWPVPVRRARSAQGSSLWNRPPHAVKFSAGPGKADFVVIVLHMKADYNGDFAAHRQQEAEALVDALPAVRDRFTDRDIVLLGDTNQIADTEPSSKAFQAAGLTDLNPGTTRTNWRSGTMDRVFVPAGRPAFDQPTFLSASDAFKRSRGWDDREFKRRLSDHFLVVTRVRAVPDDD